MNTIAPYLLQVWIYPAIDVKEVITVHDTPLITLKMVEISTNDKKRIPSTLIEMEGTQNDMFQPSPDIYFLGRLISKLSFSLLMNFSIISARVIPKVTNKGCTFVFQSGF